MINFQTSPIQYTYSGTDLVPRRSFSRSFSAFQKAIIPSVHFGKHWVFPSLDLKQTVLKYLKFFYNPDKALEDANKLVSAIRNGDLAKVQEMIKAGVNVNERDANNNYPFIEAVKAGHAGIIDQLIKANANLFIQDPYNNCTVPVFHIAASRGHLSVLDIFLRHERLKIALNESFAGATPLSFALKGKHMQVVEQLLRAGASIDQATGEDNPLIIAIHQNNKPMVDLLLKYKISHATKQSALQVAKREGRLELLPGLYQAQQEKLETQIPFYIPPEWCTDIDIGRRTQLSEHFCHFYHEAMPQHLANGPITEEMSKKTSIQGKLDRKKPVFKFYKALADFIPLDTTLQWELPVADQSKTKRTHTHVITLSRGAASPNLFTLQYFDNEYPLGKKTKVEQTIRFDLESGQYVRQGLIQLRNNIMLLPQTQGRPDLNPLYQIVQDLYRCLILESENIPSGWLSKRDNTHTYGPLMRRRTATTREHQELKKGLTLDQLKLWKIVVEVLGEWEKPKAAWLDLAQTWPERSEAAH